jgi:hypothetical protein
MTIAMTIAAKTAAAISSWPTNDRNDWCGFVSRLERHPVEPAPIEDSRRDGYRSPSVR